MKIAITAKGSSMQDEVDPRFGRAAFILIVDLESMEVDPIDNSASINAMKGAGIQAATVIHDKGAEVLLTGYCGPKAFKIAKAANIKIINDVSGIVEQVVEKFKEGKLTYSQEPNKSSHW